MRILKYKTFHKWAKKEGLTNGVLINAVNEMKKGLFEVNLGSGLYKKRVARKGQGKRGGYRTLVAFKKDNKIFFIYGFAKKERDDITDKEEFVYKKLANDYLNLSDNLIDGLIRNGELYEVIL